MESENKQYAENARKSLHCHFDKMEPEYKEIAIIDLIADLYHLAKQNGLDPEQISGTAWNHYREEIEAEEGK